MCSNKGFRRFRRFRGFKRVRAPAQHKLRFRLRNWVARDLERAANRWLWAFGHLFGPLAGFLRLSVQPCQISRYLLGRNTWQWYQLPHARGVDELLHVKRTLKLKWNWNCCRPGFDQRESKSHIFHLGKSSRSVTPFEWVVFFPGRLLPSRFWPLNSDPTLQKNKFTIFRGSEICGSDLQ